MDSRIIRPQLRYLRHPISQKHHHLQLTSSKSRILTNRSLTIIFSSFRSSFPTLEQRSQESFPQKRSLRIIQSFSLHHVIRPNSSWPKRRPRNRWIDRFNLSLHVRILWNRKKRFLKLRRSIQINQSWIKQEIEWSQKQDRRSWNFDRRLEQSHQTMPRQHRRINWKSHRQERNQTKLTWRMQPSWSHLCWRKRRKRWKENCYQLDLTIIPI